MNQSLGSFQRDSVSPTASQSGYESTRDNRTQIDHAIVNGMIAGDPNALEALYQHYAGGVFSFLMARLGDQQLSEEVLQDVMLSAWQHAATFRGESKLLTWLLAIAKNRAINARRKGNVISASFDDVRHIISGDTEPLERLARDARYGQVRAALQNLPSTYREVLILVFYHQLSLAEIATVIGISEGGVKTRLHRAKESLRQSLTHQDPVSDYSDSLSRSEWR